MPEESAPGESQSNGAAERATRMVEDQLRTMKLALEHRTGAKIPCRNSLIRCTTEHAAMLLTNYHRSAEDQRTGYGRLYGHASDARIAEFGETVMWYVAKPNRHDLDPIRRMGVFTGSAWSSNQNFILLPDGTVTRARAMIRVVESKR